MINVLIIDDDAMVAELNRRYVAQIPGFQCCGTASTLEKAKEIIFNSDTPIDLILLDIYMQKENGLDLLPVLHNARCKSDVIVISSAADAATIKDSLHYGVVDYLIKPFQASRFEEALTGWRQKKMALEKHQYYDQAELDQLIHGSSSNEPVSSRITLECHVPVNILFADTRIVEGSIYGHMVIDLPDDPQQFHDVLRWLDHNHISYLQED